MGKKNKEKTLGRALIKDRFGSNKRRNVSDSYVSNFFLNCLHCILHESSSLLHERLRLKARVGVKLKQLL